MNHLFKIPFLIIPVMVVLLNSCAPDIPVLTTTIISNTTQTTATSGGNITDDGGADVTNRGVCWNTTGNPMITDEKTLDGSGTGSFTSSLTELTPATPYFVRAYATNEAGTGYGNQQQFTTGEVLLATLTTKVPSDITQTTVTSGGNITSDGGSLITEKGVCWSKSMNPTTSSDHISTDGSGTGQFTIALSLLSVNTTYYIRAYAKNSAGTAYGNEEEFKTGELKDADGNSYSSVTIGNQIWMVENLKTSKFNNGDPVENVIDNTKWSNLTTPGFCWYNNLEANGEVYGALYNWYAVADSRGICPTGWHVATDADWTALINFAGGADIAGGKLKEAETIHWATPNTGAVNQYGFTALPGGRRNSSAIFYFMGEYGRWWSSNEVDPENSWSRGMAFDNTIVDRDVRAKVYGLSVHCLKD